MIGQAYINFIFNPLLFMCLKGYKLIQTKVFYKINFKQLMQYLKTSENNTYYNGCFRFICE